MKIKITVVPATKENEYETFDLPDCIEHLVKFILGVTPRNAELIVEQYIAEEDADFDHMYKLSQERKELDKTVTLENIMIETHLVPHPFVIHCRMQRCTSILLSQQENLEHLKEFHHLADNKVNANRENWMLSQSFHNNLISTERLPKIQRKI
jgi:hypothetical protein